MAAPVYTYVPIYDEVKAALDMNADDTQITASTVATTYLTEAIINRLVYRNLLGTESSFTADKAATGIYIAPQGYRYWLLPTFTGEDDVEYTVNSTGSIEVTSGTHSTDSITVSAAEINFCLLMVDVLRYIANHFARKAAQSFGSTSISPQTVRAECMRQASHWTSENYLDT